MSADAVEYRCSVCGALKGHAPLCSLAPIEYKAAEMERYYQAWLSQQKHYHELCKRLCEKATFWQGKHAMLRHENNRLRKKLRERAN